MFGFSAGEILLIGLIALVLFGNENLPQNIKKFLKGWNKTKKVAADLQKSLHDIKLDITNNISFEDEKELLQKPIKEINHTLQANAAIKPVQNIVSQEEIDNYQSSLEAPEVAHTEGEKPEPFTK